MQNQGKEQNNGSRNQKVQPRTEPQTNPHAKKKDQNQNGRSLEL